MIVIPEGKLTPEQRAQMQPPPALFDPDRKPRFITIKGKFDEHGVSVMRWDRGFDMAISKADCEVVIAGRLQRFIGEELLADEHDAQRTALYAQLQSKDADHEKVLDELEKLPEKRTRQRPDMGWVSMLCASTDVLQLQGKPNDTWALSAAIIESDVAEREARRKAFYEEEGALDAYKPGQFVLAPVGDVLDTTGAEYMDHPDNTVRR